MGSRDKVLQRIAGVRVEETVLPAVKNMSTALGDPCQRFIEMVAAVGGKVIEVSALEKVPEIVESMFLSARIVSTIVELPWYSHSVVTDPHQFEDLDLAILRSHFGVAENGALWITDELMGDRVIPFIVQHLALILEKKNIVPTLHDAYDRIGSSGYDFGTFIAGPSKTADIEQSLVFGAHGPKSLTVFLVS